MEALIEDDIERIRSILSEPESLQLFCKLVERGILEFELAVPRQASGLELKKAFASSVGGLEVGHLVATIGGMELEDRELLADMCDTGAKVAFRLKTPEQFAWDLPHGGPEALYEGLVTTFTCPRNRNWQNGWLVTAFQSEGMEPLKSGKHRWKVTCSNWTEGNIFVGCCDAMRTASLDFGRSGPTKREWVGGRGAPGEYQGAVFLHVDEEGKRYSVDRYGTAWSPEDHGVWEVWVTIDLDEGVFTMGTGPDGDDYGTPSGWMDDRNNPADQNPWATFGKNPVCPCVHINWNTKATVKISDYECL